MTRLVLPGALALSSLGAHVTLFRSTILPYTIQEPANFYHIIIGVRSGATDYFYPNGGRFYRLWHGVEAFALLRPGA